MSRWQFEASSEWFGDRARIDSPRAGDIVYAQGDDHDRLYLVLDGAVQLEHTGVGHAHSITRLVTRNHFFGEDAAFEPGRRHHTARGLNDCVLASLTRYEIDECIRENPARAAVLLAALSRRARQGYEELATTVFDDSAAAVARELLNLPQTRCSATGQRRVEVDLSQEQFANMVGISRETMNRILRSFAQRGWLRRDKRTMILIDPAKLARRSTRAISTRTRPIPHPEGEER